jgi:putative transposase
MAERRAKRISFDQEGEVHEYTFSTYRRQPFLDDEEYCRIFLRKLGQARRKHGFLVWAYVLMPEHVHLLINAQRATTSAILKSVKQSTSQTIVASLKREDPERLQSMVSGSRRGDSPYSFWQVGGGYDRNVHGAKESWGCIRYIHWNPVRRGLVEKPEDWPWSSARNYLERPPYAFEVDRCVEWI